MLHSNLQFIEYVISIEDTEQQFGSISITNTNLDFFAALEVKSFQLNFNNQSANETATTFASKRSQNLFVTREEEKSELLTTVYFEESNGFLAMSEVIHTLTLSDDELLQIKASIDKNKSKNFKFIVFPTADFFTEINQYKSGKKGKSMNTQLSFVVEYEF